MKAEDPDRKAIVFSQFTSFFDILRPFLKRAGIKFVVCECKILLSHFCRFLYMLALDWQFLLMLCYSTTRLWQIKEAWTGAFILYTLAFCNSVFEARDWLHCTPSSYGSHSKKREESLTAIRDDPRTTVILVSLKAGAQGLNLTCCSTVFMVDLWWNPAIEVGSNRCHWLLRYDRWLRELTSHRIKLLIEPIVWVRRRKWRYSSLLSRRL